MASWVAAMKLIGPGTRAVAGMLVSAPKLPLFWLPDLLLRGKEDAP